MEKSLEELQSDLTNNALLHGENHISTGEVWNRIGTLHFNKEDYIEALKCYEKAYAIAKEELGEDDEFAIDIHYRIGRCLESKSVTADKVNEAKEHQRRNLQYRKKLDGQQRFAIGTSASQRSLNSGGGEGGGAGDDESLASQASHRVSLDSLDSTLVYSDMAEQARLEGDYEKAQPLYIKSIELRRKKFGDSHPALAPVLLNYGELLRMKGNYEAAKAVLNEALSINMNAYGKIHRVTADSMNNLGQVCRLLGELDLAEQALSEALFIRRGLFGDLDLNVGASLNNLAELYREKQDYQEAINYHNLAIDAFRAAGGEDHPGTINAKGNLGITLRRYAGVNAAQGEELIRDTVEYLNANEYNPQHPWLLKFGSEHAISEAEKLAKQGKHEQSLEVYDSLYQKKIDMNQIPAPAEGEAVAAAATVTGEPSSPTAKSKPPPNTSSAAGTATTTPMKDSTGGEATVVQAAQDVQLISRGKFTSMLGLAQNLLLKAKYTEAEKVISECMLFDKALLGASNVDAANVTANSASNGLGAAEVDTTVSTLLVELSTLRVQLVYCLGKFERATELCVEALQAKVDLFGPDSEKIADVLLLMADCYRAVGNYEECESFLNQAVTLISTALKQDQQALGGAKPSLKHLVPYLGAIVNLAELHRNKGAYPVAVPLLNEALTLCHENLLEDELIMGECYTSLAHIERTKGDFVKCLEYHNCALENRNKRFGRNHPKVASTLAHTARIHIQQCEFASAGKLLQEIDTIRKEYFTALAPTHPAMGDTLLLRAEMEIAQGQWSNAHEYLTQLLEQRLTTFGDRHPASAWCFKLMADVLREQLKFEEARRLYANALSTYKELFVEQPHHDATTSTIFGTALLAAKCSQFADSMPIFEECIGLKRQVMEELGSEYHSDHAAMNLAYAEVALQMGMVTDSQQIFGQCGVETYTCFQTEQHLRVADALFCVAEASKAQGKYRDAKHQYTMCMSIKHKYLDGQHSDLLHILYAAADNMRCVGYFTDAMDAAVAMETLAEETLGKGSVVHALALKLKAHILCDHAFTGKAEALYLAALEILVASPLGERNIHVLEVKMGLSRCLAQQGKMTESEKAHKDAGAVARSLLGPNNHITMNNSSNTCMTRLNRRPEEGAQALALLKDQILPYYTENYGPNHPYTIHTQGRIGLFMNMAKKESGRKHIQKALKLFDEYKQYAFTHDHPWVLELGGYIKRSSQERLSHAVEVHALGSWCMPKFEGDTNYGVVPKHFWVDLSNHAPEVWGGVHYYGVQREPSAVTVLPILAAAWAQSGAGLVAGESSVLSSSQEPLKAEDSGVDGGSEGEGGALAKERAARQDAEDLLAHELESRKSIELALEEEQVARAKLEAMLEREKEERQKLEAMHERSIKHASKARPASLQPAEHEEDVPRTMSKDDADAAGTVTPPLPVSSSSSSAAAGVKEEKAVVESPLPVVPESGPAAVDAPPALTAPSEEPAPAAPEAAPEAAQEAAEGQAVVSEPVEPVAEAVEGPEGGGEAVVDGGEGANDDASSIKPEEQGSEVVAAPAQATTADSGEPVSEQAKSLAAAAFMYDRAMELFDNYSFPKALPLLEECLRVRQEHASNDEVTVETLTSLARNLTKLHRWDEAEEYIKEGMKLGEKVCGIESMHFAELILVKGENSLAKGCIADAVKTFAKTTKLITKVLVRHPEANILLGRSVCNQSTANLKLGKIPEAKAMADRGHAILTKAFGNNHPAVLEAMQAKTQLLCCLQKYKEANALVEQTYATRRRLLGDDHPLVSDCLLLQAISLAGLGKYDEAQLKLFSAKEIRNEVFGANSVELAEIVHEEALVARQLCQFQEALNQHLEVLKIRTSVLWEKSPILSDAHQKLGELYTELAMFSVAEVHLQQAREIRILLPADEKSYHPLVAETKAALGDLRRVQGAYDTSKGLLEEALEEQKVLFGKENGAYLRTQQIYGLLLRDTGDIANAEKLNKRTLKYRRQLLGNDHPDLGLSLLHQIDVLIAKGGVAGFTEAGMLYNEAAGILKLCFGEYPLHTALVQMELVEGVTQLTKLHQAHIEGEEEKERLQLEEAQGGGAAKAAAAAEGAEAEAEEQEKSLAGKDEEAGADSTTAAATVVAGEAPGGEEAGGEVPPEEIAAAAETDPDAVKLPPGDGEGEKPHALPVFPNEDFVSAMDSFKAAIEKLQRIYAVQKPSGRSSSRRKREIAAASESQKQPPTTSTQAEEENIPGAGAGAGAGIPGAINHPLIFYLEGCVGSTMVLEHSAKQRFADSLTVEDREAYNNQESFDRLQSREVKTKPPGLVNIEKAVESLEAFPQLLEGHCWLLRLKDAISNVVFVLDDMEVAANTFIEAEILHRRGHFVEADAKFEEVFLTQMESLGPHQASTSLVVAETLYGKAETCRSLGEIELAKHLYNESIAIYRKQLGGENEGVMKGIVGLTSLLVAQGLYEDAQSMHTRVLNIYTKQFGDQSLQALRVKVLLAFDLFKLAKFNKVLQLALPTLKSLEDWTENDHYREDLSDLHCTVALTYLALSQFGPCREHLEKAHNVLEGPEQQFHGHEDILIPMTTVLEARTEYLLVISKVFDAMKASAKALKMRLKSFGRMNRIAEGNKGAERKMAFFDALDSLGAETSKEAAPRGEEDGPDAAAAGRRVVNHAKSRQEAADQQLDDEMTEAFTSVAGTFGEGEDGGEALGTASVSSMARFGQKNSGNRVAAYVHRSVPVQEHPAIADCLLLRGRVCLVSGDLLEAKEVLEGSLNILNALFPRRPSQKKLSVAFELAELTCKRGGIEEARSQHTSILQQRLQLLDDEHPDRADCLYRIAAIHNMQCKYDDSTQILTEALSLRKLVFGDLHYKVAEVFAECALVLHYKGFHNDSEALYEKAMAVAKRTFGDLHLLIARILVGQAQNARELGLLEQANALFDQATSMRTILLGEGHADTAACNYQQSFVMRALGKILDCKRLLDGAIAIQREKLGKYHVTTSATLLAIAINFSDLAKYQTASHVFNRALQLLKKSLGADHILIADGLEGMAENQRCQGYYDDAKQTHEKCLYLRRKLLGDRHHTIARSTYFISEIFLLLANFEEATKGFDDAIALQRMALGQAHPAVATTLHGLGKVLLARGLVSDAKSVHDRAYFIRKSSLQGDHPDIGDSQYCNAQVYKRMGKYDQAGALFDRCLVTVRDSRGARHPLVAATIYQSGEVASAAGRYVEAEALMLEALQIRQSVFAEVNENHPDIAETYNGLAENLRLLGRCTVLEDGETLIPEMKEFRSLSSKQAQKQRQQEGEGSPQRAPYDVSVGPAGAVANDSIGELGSSSEAAAAAAADDEDEVVEALLSGTSVRGSAVPHHHPHKQGTTSSNNNSSSSGDSALATTGGPPPAYDPTSSTAVASQPTVEISAIEDLDQIEEARQQNLREQGLEDGAEAPDDNSIPEPHIDDSRALTDNPKAYNAQALLQQVLSHLSFTFAPEHPTVLYAQFCVAETLRNMGKYDLSLEQHNEILTTRRKVLGDTHPDTVLSMLAIGETLRGLGKIYPETASGTADAKSVRVAKQAMSLGVGLMDHLGSLVTPLDADWAAGPPTTSKKPPNAAWEFISQPDGLKKKKEALKLPKGYMGYQFPPIKKIVRKEENSASRPKKVKTGDAKWLFDSAVMVMKRTHGENTEHPVLAKLLFAKGELLRARGDNSAALQHFDAALGMRRKLFRGNHPCIADCINGMAEVLRSENKFRQALPMYDKAMEIRMEAFGNAHPSVAEVKNNLAMLRFTEGKFTEAQSLFEDALGICETMLGANHPGTGLCLLNLAGMLHAAGQFREALPLYKRALEIKKLTYGEEHAEVANTLVNIGLLYKALKMYAEAEDCYQKALALQKAMYGATHKDIATTINNLASLYVSQQKKYEAKELYKESVAMRSALFGVEHPTVASTLNNYAGLLFSLGEYEPAKDYFDDALRIRRKVLGDEHVAVAETLNNIGLLLYTQGQLKEALPLYERALEIKRIAYGNMNPSVATSLNNLATLYHKTGHFEHATILYTEAHEIRKEVLGEVHDDTLVVEENLKAVARDQARYHASMSADAARRGEGAMSSVGTAASTGGTSV